MAPRSTIASLAFAGLAAVASAQPAPGLAPLSPQVPSFVIPDLPPDAPRTLVRAVEQAKADPSKLPPYAPALIKSATTPVQLKTKEEHKAEWAKVQAEWNAEHPDGYKGMENKGRRLAGHKGGDDEAGEAVVKVHKAKKAHGDGEAGKAHKAKATKTYAVGEAVAGKMHKGRLLLGHKDGGEAVMGEAVGKVHKAKKSHDDGEAVAKVHKSKKVHGDDEAGKKHKKTVVYVDEAGSGKKHKGGRRLAGHKGAVDGEAGEAMVVVKTKKVKGAKHAAADEAGEAMAGKHGKKHG